MKYIRYDARLGTTRELTEKEYKKAINKRYVLRVWDSYYQEFTDTYYDSRDSIVRIFYWSKGEDE